MLPSGLTAALPVFHGYLHMQLAKSMVFIIKNLKLVKCFFFSCFNAR